MLAKTLVYIGWLTRSVSQEKRWKLFNSIAFHFLYPLRHNKTAAENHINVWFHAECGMSMRYYGMRYHVHQRCCSHLTSFGWFQASFLYYVLFEICVFDTSFVWFEVAWREYFIMLHNWLTVFQKQYEILWTSWAYWWLQKAIKFQKENQRI